jgi:hypothetical protein
MRRIEVGQGLTAFDWNFDIVIGRAVFGGMLVLTWGGCFWPHIDINIGLAA